MEGTFAASATLQPPAEGIEVAPPSSEPKT
jgi:hypothetical protein